ncbi:MAG: hypothetical protein ACO1TE_13465 [Prosthecobacter sp.]
MGFLVYQRKRVMRRKIEAQLQKKGLYGDEVVRGPFKGMKFPTGKYASARFEKIIGTNEHELFPLLERLAVTKHYSEIINVGAAEGFYGVGLAMLFKDARVICYEALEDEREQCRQMLEANGVGDRVEIRGRCSASDLAAHKPAQNTLVWMDIDTGERQVLDPALVPWLKNVDICVELHDCLEAGLSDLIRGRFEKTHRIERFTLSGLDYDKYPELQGLLFDEIHAMVEHDRRGLHDWFFMEPLNRS